MYVWNTRVSLHQKWVSVKYYMTNPLRKHTIVIKITRLFFYAFSMNEWCVLWFLDRNSVTFYYLLPPTHSLCVTYSIYKRYVFIAFGFYFTFYFYCVSVVCVFGAQLKSSQSQTRVGRESSSNIRLIYMSKKVGFYITSQLPSSTKVNNPKNVTNFHIFPTHITLTRVSTINIKGFFLLFYIKHIKYSSLIDVYFAPRRFLYHHQLQR